MKNVLICGYDFPPIGGPASLRLTSFVSRMPSLGWTPHVVTVRENQGIIANRDPELAARLPAECHIHRTDLVEPHANSIYRLLMGPDDPFDVAAGRARLMLRRSRSGSSGLRSRPS